MRLSHPPQQLGRGTGLHARRSICQHSRNAVHTRSLNTAARAASNSAGSASSFAHSVAADAAAAASSSCPFTALKSQLSVTTWAQPKQEAASVPGPAPFSLESLGDVCTIFFDGLHVAMLSFSQKYGPVCRCVSAGAPPHSALPLQPESGCLLAARARAHASVHAQLRPAVQSRDSKRASRESTTRARDNRAALHCAAPCNLLSATNRFANPASLNGATSWVFINSPENVQHVCTTNVKNFTMRYLPVSVCSGT